MGWPRDDQWSSYRSRAGREAQTRLDLDERYLSLGATPQERAKHDRAWVRGAIPEGTGEDIRQAIQRGQLTGGDRFVGEVARTIDRRVERRGQGRPLKKYICPLFPLNITVPPVAAPILAVRIKSIRAGNLVRRVDRERPRSGTGRCWISNDGYVSV